MVVTFDSNGGSAVASQDVQYGQSAALPAEPTLSNAEFGGWYSDPALSSQYVFSNSVYAPRTIYAKWNAYNVTVNGGTGTGYYSDGDIVTVTADSPAAGMMFTGWSIGSGSALLSDRQEFLQHL